jgi:hypothetical protein
MLPGCEKEDGVSLRGLCYVNCSCRLFATDHSSKKAEKRGESMAEADGIITPAQRCKKVAIKKGVTSMAIWGSGSILATIVFNNICTYAFF